MTEHTALPWERHYPLLHADKAEQITQVTADGTLGEIIASCVKPANARFIVAACNCHADLLEALQLMLQDHGDVTDRYHHGICTCAACTFARKVIRKVEEIQ